MASRLPAYSPNAQKKAIHQVLACRSARELRLSDRHEFFTRVASPHGTDPTTVDRFWYYVIHGPDRLVGFTEEAKHLMHTLTPDERRLDAPGTLLEALHSLVKSFADRSEPCHDSYVFEATC